MILTGMVMLCSAGMTAREIRGIVIGNDSIPVEYATVAMFENDSVVGGASTDGNGRFLITSDAGCDSIRVSAIGYETRTLIPAGPDAGRIILGKISTTLKEVEVKAPLVRREADRFVLNIAANPLSANKDAQQLLRTAPGVWATDDALSIYGQGGVDVYIDDRKVRMSGKRLMTYLKSIQSSAIATIEIIPRAGAEYSASAAGGVIKINLRRNRVDGVNGSAGMNVTAGEYMQELNPFVNVSMHSGKFTTTVNGNLSGTPSDRYKARETTTNASLDQTMTGLSRHKSRSIYGNMSVGLFCDFSARDRAGVQVDYNPGRSRSTSQSRTETSRPGTESSTRGSYRSDNHSDNFIVALNWTHSTDTKGSYLKLVSNYSYQSSKVLENNFMAWSDMPKDSMYRTDNLNRYNVFTTNLSYRAVFKPGWYLNAGAKYTLNDVDTRSLHSFRRSEVWQPNERFDYDSGYDENIAAAYITANGHAGRWKFKAGLRGEYYKTTVGTSSFDLFPNANLLYDITEKGDYTVALGWSRKIRRPSFWSLNPVVNQISDYTYTVGNPRLTSSFSNSLSLDFVLARKYTVAAGYSSADHPIRQMFASNPDYPERLYMTWGNEGKDRTMFVHANGMVNLTGWWSLYASATYAIVSQKLSDNAPFETFGYVQLVASTTFQLPKSFSFTTDCFYMSRMKVGNITLSPILNLNPTLQRQFGKSWSMSLGVDNVLQRVSRISTESSGYHRFSRVKAHITGKIGATYKFSSGKKFKARKIEKNTDTSRLTKD